MEKCTTLSQCVGNEVRNARMSKKLTQKELAGMIGTYQPSIAKLESGKSLPSLGFLNKIAETLGTEIHIKMRV